MKVLVLNCGSSSVKVQLVDVTGDAPNGLRRLGRGVVTGIPGHTVHCELRIGDRVVRESLHLTDHLEAARALLGRFLAEDDHARIDAVGHRVVHGGDRYSASTLLDATVLSDLEALEALAPLHNGPSVAGIRAAHAVLGAAVPTVVAFDTAFHHDLPERTARYPIPRPLADRYRIRRYGFHGLSYRSMIARYEAVSGRPVSGSRIIALHLGGGCSAAAIRDGRSVDTSMGFTPLEGLMMGTRSGDVDPALVAYLAERERVSAGDVESWLNTRSGLLGVSGLTGDMRTLLERESEDANARMAIEMFCDRARKYIGAYLATLAGADAVIFGGGVGEHAPAIRARIAGGFDWCGLRLDPARNAACVGREARITADDASMAAFVIPTDEEGVIARDTARLVSEQMPPARDTVGERRTPRQPTPD